MGGICAVVVKEEKRCFSHTEVGEKICNRLGRIPLLPLIDSRVWAAQNEENPLFSPKLDAPP